MDWLLVVVVGIVAAFVVRSRLIALQRRITELEGRQQRLAGRIDGLEAGSATAPKQASERPVVAAAAAAPAAPSVAGPVEIPAEIVPAAIIASAEPVTETQAPARAVEPAPAGGRRPAWPKPGQVQAEAAAARAETAQKPPSPAPPPPPREPRGPVDWERTLGVRLPVWGGAIMLLIAGYFLINWAIESGAYLFAPELRVALCGLAAAGLLAAAFIVKARRIANGERIAAALAAAGIAVAYGTVFLAAGVFRLVPDVAGLFAAGVVTVAAIAIATQFGQRVMLVGLLGGYLSPLFAWSAGSSGVMATYLVMLLAVSVFAIRWNGWWGQTILAIAAPALWALALVWAQDPVTLAVLYVLLAAVPAAAALLPLRDDAAAEPQKARMVQLGFLAASACAVLGVYWTAFDMALVIATVLLGLGGAALVARHSERMMLAWVPTLAAGLFMLAAWTRPDGPTFLVVALLVAAIHLGALALQFRAGAARARQAFQLAGLSALLFVILLVKLDGWLGARDVPYLWAATGLGVAVLFGWLAYRLREEGEGDGPSAGFAAGASAFLSLALGLVLDPGLYALTAALQALGLALLYLRFRVPALRLMHIAYVCLYGVLVAIGQLVSMGRLVLPADALGASAFIPSTGVGEAPLTLLLLPGLALLAAATAFARIAYSSLPRVLDAAGVALLGLAIHLLIAPPGTDMAPGLFELLEHPLTLGVLWFNALALLALASAYAAVRLGRGGLFEAGIGVALVVALAMLVSVFLPVSRFWTEMEVPGPPVFNAALAGIGLPSVLLLGVAALARRKGTLNLARGLAAFGGLGGLVTILVLIRQAIHGPTLMGPGSVSSQVELYFYSAGMLVYGFALLWGGIAFSSLALRAGSLVVVLATIGKVFFYDVGGLEGLWRVGSFLGLGIALLVVSWFYGRFVFGLGAGKVQQQPELQ